MLESIINPQSKENGWVNDGKLIINDRIAHCASFLQKEGTGLQFIFNLYDEIIQDWTGWKAKTLNENNKLEDLNCNK